MRSSHHVTALPLWEALVSEQASLCEDRGPTSFLLSSALHVDVSLYPLLWQEHLSNVVIESDLI